MPYRGQRPMNIFLAVDGSDCTARMMAHLVAHRELLPGEHRYTAFTVVEPFVPPEAAFDDCGSLEELMRERAEQVLEPLRALATQRGWKLLTDYGPGPAIEAIVAKAEILKVDLIVMGTHSRSALAGFVLGSVTSGVLANCKLPVLLLR
jgi:nucleotide-binding universal stress UspA family protein